jgi:hypothetical protein
MIRAAEPLQFPSFRAVYLNKAATDQQGILAAGIEFA